MDSSSDGENIVKLRDAAPRKCPCRPLLLTAKSYHIKSSKKYQDNEDPFAILSISIGSDFTVDAVKDAYKIAVPRIFERGGSQSTDDKGAKHSYMGTGQCSKGQLEFGRQDHWYAFTLAVNQSS